MWKTFNMAGDQYPDQVPADRDEEMEAFDISPMALSFEAAGIIGMCSTILIGNGLLCVLSFRKPASVVPGKCHPVIRGCGRHFHRHYHNATDGCLNVGA